jgi:hypothetical protein
MSTPVVPVPMVPTDPLSIAPPSTLTPISVSAPLPEHHPQSTHLGQTHSNLEKSHQILQPSPRKHDQESPYPNKDDTDADGEDVHDNAHPLQLVEIDIEHVPVDDDPRDWSVRKKVSPGIFRPPRLL